jgi:hypothetical protein
MNQGAAMLYKFKSQTTGDLIMLGPNGRRVLEIIGKDPAPKGIVLPDQMPEAIARLEAAVAEEEANARAATGQDNDNKTDNKPAEGGAGIGLRQRVVPFIDMLKRCHKAGSDIVWGV